MPTNIPGYIFDLVRLEPIDVERADFISSPSKLSSDPSSSTSVTLAFMSASNDLSFGTSLDSYGFAAVTESSLRRLPEIFSPCGILFYSTRACTSAVTVFSSPSRVASPPFHSSAIDTERGIDSNLLPIGPMSICVCSSRLLSFGK